MKKFYHATPYSNLCGILCNGLKTGVDKVIYLAETKEAALKFICIRCFDPIGVHAAHSLCKVVAKNGCMNGCILLCSKGIQLATEVFQSAVYLI